MAKGGKRPGAGRPKGSTVRPALRDFYSPKELSEFIASLKERAKTDPQLAKFVAEQIFGKAPQPLTDDEGNAIAVASFTIISNENNHAGTPANG